MIRYALACEREHPFEGWFGASNDYDDQQAKGQLQCPTCGSTAVRKQIMAPAVVNARSPSTAPAVEGLQQLAAEAPSEVHAVMLEVINRVRTYVETHFEDVGDRFAEEARDIHDGVADERPIYGQATGEEVRALIDEGVPIAPLPMAVRPRPKLN